MNSVQRTNWSAIVLLVLVGVSAAMEFAKVSAVFDAVADHYQADASTAAWFVSVPAIGTMVFALSGSVVAERIGFRRAIISSLLLALTLSLVEAFLPAMPVFVAARVLDGIVQLGITVASPVLIIQLAKPADRALAMAIWGTFFGAAFALAGLLAPAILSAFGLSAVFLAHALFAAVLCALITFRLPHVKTERGAAPVATEGFVRAHVSAYRLPRAFLPGAVFIWHTALYAVFVLFVPDFVDAAVRPILLVWMPLISIFSTIAAGIIAGRWVSPPLVLIGGYIGVAVLLAVTVITGADPVAALVFPLALMFCSGFIQGASFSLMPALSVDPDVTARSNGVLMQLGNLGTLIGPPLFAAVFSMALSGSSLAFILTTSVFAAGGVLVSLLALRLTGVRPHTA